MSGCQGGLVIILDGLYGKGNRVFAYGVCGMEVSGSLIEVQEL